MNTLASYEQFARVYDFFMDETPYAKWVRFIDRELRRLPRRNNAPPIVADLACGTGSVTVPLARKGYDMIGVDASSDMLAEARDKATRAKTNVLFLMQDLRALDLFGTIDAAVCVCDGLNYLLTETDLTDVFKRVALFLNPGGLFVFDMNTAYKFQTVYGEQTFSASGEDASYLWKNRYDTETGLNEYQVDFFVNGEHFRETHYQRAYPVQMVTALLQTAGLRALRVNDAYSEQPFTETSERFSCVAVKSVE